MRRVGAWKIPIGAVPNRVQIPHYMVYTRGALTLEALRGKVGNGTFFRILRAWVAENKHSNVTTEHFIALAERESGLDLDRFFDLWLFQPERPEEW